MFSIHWKLCKEHTMGGRRGKHIQCPNKWLLSRNPSSESGCDSGAQAGVHTAAVIDLLIERTREDSLQMVRLLPHPATRRRNNIFGNIFRPTFLVGLQLGHMQQFPWSAAAQCAIR